MLRLRPPPPPQNTTSRRDDDKNRYHRISTEQKRQRQSSSSSSTQLKSKSATRRGGGGRQQQRKKKIDAHDDDLCSFNRKQNNDESLTQQHHHYRHRQRHSSNQDDRFSESGIHNNHHQQQQRRRRKGSSSVNNSNTQSLFIITLIRLVLVSTLVYFIVIHVISILCNIVAFLFGGLLHLSSGTGSSTSFYNYQRDSAYVQNVEEIRKVLELARTEYDILQTSSKTQLHSVRDEERIGYFESILHPGDKSVKLSVPKFYASVSIGENGSVNIGGQTMFRQLTLGKLLTPELARMIGGARSSSDPSSSSETTIDPPAPYDRTIFVSIISKSDSQCSTTVSNLFKFATNPERIRVAVVDRTNTLSSRYVSCDTPPIPCSSDPTQMLCKYTSNIDVYEMKLEHDAGVMFARHIGQRMYRGEYYALQVGVDAGIVFSDGWDEELIRQLEATGNEMAVLSTYLSDAKIRDASRPISAKPERFTLCHASYKGDGRERRLEHIRSEQVHQSVPPDRTQTPMLQPFWGSEFSFSRGHYVLQVPYDPKLCGLDEQDEEISMALRAFTSGYDFYAPTQSVIFRTKGRGGSTIHSDVVASCKGNAKNKSRKRLYSLIGLNNNDEDATPHECGLGAVRDVAKFFTLYGIHAAERVTEHRLCEFVTTGNMHDEFVPHLRQDGMGIDYNRISFRFHELISIHKDSHQ